MRSSIRLAVLICLGIVGCGAPEAKPPKGAESSETKLDIELESGDPKASSEGSSEPGAPSDEAPGAASDSPAAKP